MVEGNWKPLEGSGYSQALAAVSFRESAVLLKFAFLVFVLMPRRDHIVSAQVVGSCLAASLHTKGIQDMIEGQNFG